MIDEVKNNSNDGIINNNINSISQDDVLRSISASFDNNKKLSNEFNKALYKGLRESLSNLSLEEVNSHHASR